MTLNLSISPYLYSFSTQFMLNVYNKSNLRYLLKSLLRNFNFNFYFYTQYPINTNPRYKLNFYPSNRRTASRIQTFPNRRLIFGLSSWNSDIFGGKRSTLRQFILRQKKPKVFRNNDYTTSYSSIIHSSRSWTSTFLLSKTSYTLLGVALRKHYKSRSISFSRESLANIQGWHKDKKRVLLSNNNLIKFQQPSARLSLFLNFIQLSNPATVPTKVSWAPHSFNRKVLHRFKPGRLFPYLFLDWKRLPPLSNVIRLSDIWRYSRKLTILPKNQKSFQTRPNQFKTLLSYSQHAIKSKLMRSDAKWSKRVRHVFQKLTINSTRNQDNIQSNHTTPHLPPKLLNSPLGLSTFMTDSSIPAIKNPPQSLLKSLKLVSGLASVRTQTFFPRSYSRISSPNYLGGKKNSTITKRVRSLALKSFKISSLAAKERKRWSTKFKRSSAILANGSMNFTSLQLGLRIPAYQFIKSTYAKAISKNLTLGNRYLVSSKKSIIPTPYTHFSYLTGVSANKDQSFLITPYRRLRFSFAPSAGFRFLASPFYYLNFMCAPLPGSTDLLKSLPSSTLKPSYTIFPDSDSIKALFFRRLNRQRLLFQARKSFSVEGWVRLKNSLPQSSPTLILNGSNSVIKGSGLNFASLKFSTQWIANLQLNLLRRRIGKSLTPRIRRIRFKPGYNRIWRVARTSIRDLLDLTTRYQYRLTPKLQKRYFQSRKLSTEYLSFTLGYALLSARFAHDNWILKELVSSGNVFLNGSNCTNFHTRLFTNDFIQLIVNLKFYIAARWLKNITSQKRTKVSKIFYRKLRPGVLRGPTKTPKKSRNLPTYFFDLQYVYSDIPKCFEVDYFTLSIFVVHDQLFFEKQLPVRSAKINNLTLNMYNWKYIT